MDIHKNRNKLPDQYLYGVLRAGIESSKALGWIQFLWVLPCSLHKSFAISIIWDSNPSPSLASQWPPWEYSGSQPHCSLWARWLQIRIKGSQAENGYRGHEAVANEQQKIIFKGALKVNCVVLLTQSLNRCCMVNFQRHCATAVQLVLDEDWIFFSFFSFFFLIDTFSLSCYLRVKVSN